MTDATSTPRGDSSAAERAYLHLRDAILEGELAAGEMLGESGLAQRLGVSRTPVRAALLRLQDERWVTIYPKRGALVNGLSERDIADIADARYMLEAAAVQRAAPEAIERLVPRLEESLVEQSRTLAAEDLRGFIDRTTAFHRLFVEVGGNQVLLEMSDRLADRRRYMLFRQGERLIERREEMLAEHRALIDALRDHDVARFAETLRAHLRDTHDARVDPMTFVP
jgi:DNA-binding GntR family transcriptional regulator